VTVGFRSARRTLRFFETESDAAAADEEEAAPVEEEVIDAVEDVEDMVVRMERDLEPCCHASFGAQPFTRPLTSSAAASCTAY
jgi:hypothetical protein